MCVCVCQSISIRVEIGNIKNLLVLSDFHSPYQHVVWFFVRHISSASKKWSSKKEKAKHRDRMNLIAGRHLNRLHRKESVRLRFTLMVFTLCFDYNFLENSLPIYLHLRLPIKSENWFVMCLSATVQVMDRTIRFYRFLSQFLRFF